MQKYNDFDLDIQNATDFTENFIRFSESCPTFGPKLCPETQWFCP